MSDEMKRSDSIALTVNADSATFLGLIPASSDTAKCERRQKKQYKILVYMYAKKEYKRATTKLFGEKGDLLLPILKRGVF